MKGIKDIYFNHLRVSVWYVPAPAKCVLRKENLFFLSPKVFLDVKEDPS